MSDSTRIIPVQAGANAPRTDDTVVVEQPLQIRVGPEPFVVTMRTPGHDEELAVGLVFSEGVVTDPDDIVSAKHCLATDDGQRGNVVCVELEAGLSLDTTRDRRNLISSSSCGLCGKVAIDQLFGDIEPLPDGWFVAESLLQPSVERFTENQELFHQTGGLHAAAAFSDAGELICLREDIGRHNAVDKVIGWAILQARWPLDRNFLIVSGRVSFEIVQKALRARIPLIAAISAASSLAVETATAGNQSLIGFLRKGRMTLYCGHRRLRG